MEQNFNLNENVFIALYLNTAGGTVILKGKIVGIKQTMNTFLQNEIIETENNTVYRVEYCSNNHYQKGDFEKIFRTQKEAEDFLIANMLKIARASIGE